MNLIVNNYSGEQIERARGIRVIFTDVDGVLTDGSITYTDDGHELKSFHVRDGQVVSFLRENNVKTGVITGRKSAMVQRRCEELGMDFCFQGVKDKLGKVRELREVHGWAWQEIAYIGDDIPDLPLIEKCGLGVSPADTFPYIQAAAALVTRKAGGEGVLREVGDLVLAAGKAMGFEFEF